MLNEQNAEFSYVSSKREIALKKIILKSALSGLRKCLAAKVPLKMMKNTFNFTSEALFVLKIFQVLY